MSVSDAAIQKVTKEINKRSGRGVVYDVQLVDEITDEMRQAAALDNRLHPFNKRYYLVEDTEAE